MYVQQPLSLTLPYLVCLPNVDCSLYLGPRMLTLLQPCWSSSIQSVFLLPQNGRGISPLLFPPLDSSSPTPLSSFHQNLITTTLSLGKTFRFQFKHNLFMQHILTSNSSPHNFPLFKKPLYHNLFLYLLAVYSLLKCIFIEQRNSVFFFTTVFLVPEKYLATQQLLSKSIEY